MEAFEQNGIWFLPETPDIKITGTLIFSPEQRAVLQLVGELKSFDIKEKLEKDIEYSLVHGYLIGKAGEADQVTLYNCYQKKQLKTGMTTTEIYPQYILKGYHFSSLDKIKFQSIIVQYKNLEKWINSSNITVNCIPDSQGNYKEINIKQEINQPIEIGKLKDCSITIIDKPWLTPDFVKFANLFGWNSSEIILKEKKKIHIESEQHRDLEYFLEVVNILQEFLTFACGQIISICDIKTYIIGKDYEYQDFGCEYRCTEVEKQLPIKIFYDLFSPINQQSFNPNQILFKFTDISHKSDVILNNWKTVKTELTPIIETYLGLYYIPVRHIKDYFLALAQAVEGFHRIHHKGEYCSKDIFQQINKELSEVFSSEFKKHQIAKSCHESLLKKIEYWNEYSLKERLEDLLSDDDFYNCLPETFFVSYEDRNDFAKQVRDTRGALTHPSSNSSKTKPPKQTSKYILSGNELEQLVNKLKIILEICLLKSLGLEPSEIRVITSMRF
jgi:hypothetical protein